MPAPIARVSTEIHTLAIRGQAAELEELLDAKPYLVDLRDDEDYTPLHLAAMHGRISAIKTLLAYNADLNARGVAFVPGQGLVLEAGYNALEIAASFGQYKARQFLRTQTRLKELHQWIQLGDLKKIETLLSSYPHLIRARDLRKGTTHPSVLHIAVMAEQKGVVEFLLKWRDNVNAKDNLGRTPLHWAVSQGSVRIVELLATHGADFQVRTKSKQTALMMAEENGFRAVNRLLRKLGAKE